MRSALFLKTPKKLEFIGSRLHPTDILTLCTLSVNLSVSVVLEWRHAQLSLMALCSTCRLAGQGSTAPEADSHKQKLCVYWHQATTSLSPVGGGGGVHDRENTANNTADNMKTGFFLDRLCVHCESLDKKWSSRHFYISKL